MATRSDTVLVVRLEKDQTLYRPGDLVRGNIHLSLSKDSPVGRVDVCLTGCTRSVINQSNGQSTSTFKGDVELFRLAKNLHDGHYTHKSGLLEWPFELEIPVGYSCPDTSNRWRPREGFLPTIDGSETTNLIPPFRFSHSAAGKSWSVFVGYSVEATVTEPAVQKALKPKTQRASTPINIQPQSAPTPIDTDDPRQRCGTSTVFTIKTLKLLPEHNGPLTIMQKTKSVLTPSKLPKLTIDFDVSYPATVQMYHHDPLPFIISASPKTDAASTTVQPSMRTFYRYPALEVKHAKLVLRACTACRCPSILSDVYASITHDISLFDQHFTDMSLSMRSLAWDQKNEVEEEVPNCIDLGKEFNILITNDAIFGKNETKTKGSRSRVINQSSISPSFSAYNISRSYILCWVIDLECAGEKIVLKGRSIDEVTVLAPAGSKAEEGLFDDYWIVAPEDNGDFEHNEMDNRSSSRDVLPAYSELNQVKDSPMVQAASEK